jgi:hypothetical protein
MSLGVAVGQGDRTARSRQPLPGAISKRQSPYASGTQNGRHIQAYFVNRMIDA